MRTWQLLAKVIITISLSLILLGSTALGQGKSQHPAQGDTTVTPTPTSTLAGPFSGQTIEPLSCGARVRGTTKDAPSQVSQYMCRPSWVETGPERVYSLYLRGPQPITVTLATEDPRLDLDLFLLEDLSPEACIAGGDSFLVSGQEQVPPTLEGLYFIVVDGFNGDAGAYTLNVECPLGPFATPTPTPTMTPTPTATPSPTATPTPSPTPTPTPTPLPYYPNYIPSVWERHPPRETNVYTITLKPGTDGFDKARDTFISAWPLNGSMGPFGDLEWVSVRTKGVMVGLVYFDIPTLPAGAQVERAVLRLNRFFQSNPNPMTLYVYRMLVPWEEQEATWHYRESGKPWGEAGGQAGVDYFPLPADGVDVNAQVDWVELDVTKIVYAWLYLDKPNYGFMLRGEGAGHVEYRFASREHRSLPRHPELIISYRR